ncbi:aminoglycoside 6-adenylyltransferase [Neobacillus sp. NPDC097160]|uniref:aminoglycoside 6-adenylyltransferase n=1 Tax=Neobacillus sp. NPDC097160 TaxID=3364298 RepID=UPI0037F76F2D
MRTEHEIMELVLTLAQKDDRVRAVGMNGSRTNPNVPKDLFRDFDIVYLVTDMDSFINDPSWVDVFGERLIMQTPENMDLFPNEMGSRFTYLIQFLDGNRIDLTLIPIEEREAYAFEDKLTVILLDKDGIMPAIPEPTDEDYWVKQPSASYFADCCNEFWWVSTYVAKGLWRQEILYAYDHLSLVRAMFLKMIEWKVGIETDFSISIGKNAKYLQRYVKDDLWDVIVKTYPTCKSDAVWEALFLMTNEFEKVALEVADQFQFEYPFEEAKRVKNYLKHVQKLPVDAKKTY